jgi:hypothetical protein
MGSPLSPILADIVMDDLESCCLRAFDFDIPIFYRYVDDIFAVVPKAKLYDILRVFNDYHPRLKFTYETEINGSINFLDTTIIREGNKLITNWYRKPTFSGRYINYFSNHPDRYKFNIITNLVDRAILLSNPCFHKSNLRTIKEILVNNGFPFEVINKYINKRINELNNRPITSDSNSIDTTNTQKNFVSIPYVKGLSENICRTLRKRDLRVLYTVPKKMDCIIKRGKDRLKTVKRTHVVYKIDCLNCDATYIGQTKRHLETRIKEHQADIKKHASNHSVISKHRLSHHHDFNWSQPEILHSEKHTKKREIAEMVFIKKYDNTTNPQRDTDNPTEAHDTTTNNI